MAAIVVVVIVYIAAGTPGCCCCHSRATLTLLIYFMYCCMCLCRLGGTIGKAGQNRGLTSLYGSKTAARSVKHLKCTYMLTVTMIVLAYGVE